MYVAYARGYEPVPGFHQLKEREGTFKTTQHSIL